MLNNKSVNGISFVDLDYGVRPGWKLHLLLANWKVPCFGSFIFCNINSVHLEPVTAHENCGNGGEGVDCCLSGLHVGSASRSSSCDTSRMEPLMTS